MCVFVIDSSYLRILNTLIYFRVFGRSDGVQLFTPLRNVLATLFLTNEYRKRPYKKKQKLKMKMKISLLWNSKNENKHCGC